MIAGGIDSYQDLFVLTQLDREQRVKSRANLDGFIPGEGAAFLLLTTEAAAAARHLPIIGRVTPMTSGFEVGHLYSTEPYKGDGLAVTFQQLVSRGVVEAPIAQVYSSMTGESHWAKEWGVAHLRSKAAMRPDLEVHHPADCCGDTGAACGPLMVGLAATGIRNRYQRGPTLVYGSSDRGARAAVVVTA
jgi:3-oxoacyl-[acyl-carrier-protein] synthase-1